MPGEFMLRFYLLAGLLAAAAFDPAAAQQPTQAQRDAIRASCRSDFIANCSGVQPGGREALECLMRNDEKLSAACREAVNAVTPQPAEAAEPPPPAAAAPPEAKPEAPAATTAPASDDALKAVQKACTLNDVMEHCSWIAPTNPEILLCLKANAAELSPGCQAAVQSLPAPAAPTVAEPKPVSPAPPPPEPTRRVEPIKKPVEPPRPSAPPAAAPAAAAAPPTEQQKAAIRAACRSDFMAHCSGVQPGGREALQCLQPNAASLSGRCQSAVAAVGGTAPAAGAPAAAAPPAAAPIGPIPMMRPRDALAILQICRAEARTLCAGTPLGGGRMLNCLAENAGSLSPECYSALSAAARQ
jgi:outer membrane biosynthesis protein TonB